MLYHYSTFWYCRSLLYYGKFLKKLGENKKQLRTLYPRNHEILRAASLVTWPIKDLRSSFMCSWQICLDSPNPLVDKF